MKFSIASTSLLLAQVQNTVAFVPSASITKVPVTQRTAILDPSIFADAHQHVDTLSSIFSSINLADAADAVAASADAAAEVAKDDNGWFGFLEGPIEFLLGAIHSTLVGVGMNEDAWGVTIIAMTSIIKLATYPLTKQQLESTNKMQVSLDRIHCESIMRREKHTSILQFVKLVYSVKANGCPCTKDGINTRSLFIVETILRIPSLSKTKSSFAILSFHLQITFPRF